MGLITTFLYNNQYRQIAKSLLLEKANAQLHHLSIHDNLTGLFNRSAFTLFFQKELAILQRTGGHAFLAIADIDHFKRLNDTCGHPFGDEVLHNVARTLRQELRETDTVARWGGEEFLLLLSQVDEKGVMEVLERLRKAVAALTFTLHTPATDPDAGGSAGGTIAVTISIGCTAVEASVVDPLDSAYKKADNGLYTAKESGRNTVVLL